MTLNGEIEGLEITVEGKMEDFVCMDQGSSQEPMNKNNDDSNIHIECDKKK